MTSINAGSFDESGWLSSLTSMGFNIELCLSELIANSIDAMNNINDNGENYIKFIPYMNGQRLLIIDNGHGMQQSDLINMFSAYKKNSECKRIGNYGIGSKAALYNLGKSSYCKVITKLVSGMPYTAFVDWTRILANQKYTGMIKISDSDTNDIKIFNDYLQLGHGTIIDIPLTADINATITNQFNYTISMDDNSNYVEPINRWGVRYGRFNTNIYFNDVKLRLYNPTSDMNNILEYEINCYKHKDKGEYYFTVNYNDELQEIKKHGSGYSTKLTTCKTNYNNFRFNDIGTFILQVFKTPSDKLITGSKTLNYYDKEYFGIDVDNSKHSKVYASVLNLCNNVKIIRNNHLIGLKNIYNPDYRANGESNLRNLINCELHYFPISTQNNPLDELIGVQVNKNQLSTDNLPKNLVRIIENIRDDYFADIRGNYSFHKPVSEPVEPVSEPDEPVSEPVEPVSEPVEPVSEPVEPVSEPVEPVSEPVEPVSEPDEPVSEPDEPVSEPDGPVSEPDGPVSEPDGPVSEPEDDHEEHVEYVMGKDIKRLINSMLNDIKDNDKYYDKYLQVFNILSE
jgi:hypothetical protein